MFKRNGIKAFVAAALMAAGLISSVALVAPASAASGDIVPGATVPQSPFTANTPFASGQNIDIAIPANSVLPPAINLQIVECSAPGGVLPTNDTTCDGETIQGASIHPRTDGSVDLHAQTNSLFTMYALPDLPQLGESSSPATCDLSNECVLYIGDDYTNFTSPHYFSPLFYVAPNGTDIGTPAGDGSAISSSLTLTKSTTTTSFSAPGQQIPYTYLVNNTGNNTVTGVSVTDNKNAVSCPSSSLDAGTGETCTGTYTTTSADVTAGSVTNLATANATDSADNPVSSTSSQVTVYLQTGPANGSVVPGADAPTGTVAHGTPFSSGQNINVVIPANSNLPPNTNINIVECSAPGGAIPTSPAACDGETIQGPSIHPNTDGSVNLQSETHSLFTLYALPDFTTLQETSGPACDLATACMLYIGDDQNNFTAPHYWSPAFYVNPNGGADNGANPGDGSALSSGLTLTKSSTASSFTAAGQHIPYTYFLNNTGNNTLTGVSVNDNRNTVNCPQSSLNPGGTETCTGTYTTTAADVTAGSVTNVATASGTDVGGNTVSSAAEQVTVYLSTGPVNGSVVPGAAAATGSFTSGLPFSSGQDINVVIPANNNLPTSTNVNIVECSAPGGVVPTSPSACDGETIQGASIHPNADGSVNLHAETNSLFTVYALPDFATLQETSGPACDLSNECVLYVGDNQNDFTVPHYWSQPFYVNPNGGVDSGANPGDGTCGTPVVSSSNSATAVAGQAFSFTVTTCSTTTPIIKGSGLPGGIALVNHGDGTATISGTTSGKYAGIDSSVVITASTQSGTGTQAFTLTVDSAPVFSSKTKDLIYTGVAMTPYPVTTVDAYPTPTITTSSTLPDGITLTDNHDGTAELQGTPTANAGGTYPLTLVADNGVGAPVNQSYTLTVYQPPTVTLPADFTITSQQPMTPQTVQYAGYPAPVLKASGLPKGVTMLNNNDGTATISGSPLFKQNGVYDVTVAARSRSGSFTTPTPLQVTVDSPAFFTSKRPLLAHTGTAITPFSVTTVYGYPTPTITAATPLPDGITLTDNGNGTATLSGTPTATAGGTYTITLDASNGVGAGGVGTGPVMQTFSWIVYQAPVLAPISDASGSLGAPITPITVTDTGYPLPLLHAKGLPPGVTLADNGDGTGTITGTPIKAGTFHVVVSAKNKAATVFQTFTFTVS